MELDIKKILQKKKLSGEELGRIILTKDATEYKQFLTGEKNEIMFSENDLHALIEKIPNKMEHEIFKKFLRIQEWINKNYVNASAYEQQAQLNLEKLINNLNMIGICEKMRWFYSSLPEIMTPKEYTELEEEKKNDFLNDETPINMIEILEEAITQSIALYNENKRKKSIGKIIYNILSKEKATEKEKKIYNGLRPSSEKKNVTKWDIFNDELLEYYKCFDYLEEGAEPTEWHLKDLERFINDFPEAFKILVDEIKKYFPEVENLPLKDWFKEKYQYKQLYKINFFNVMDTTLKNKYIMYEGKPNAIMNGVAILKTDDEKGIKKPYSLDEFIDLHCFITLDQLATPNRPDLEREIDIYHRCWNTLYRSLYFLQGYDEALEMIIKVYKLEGLEVFKSRYWWFEAKIEEFNKLIDLRYDVITSNFNNSIEHKEKKKEIYKELFKKIDFEKLKTPEKNLKQAKELILSGECFNPSSTLLINLMADYDLVKEV